MTTTQTAQATNTYRRTIGGMAMFALGCWTGVAHAVVPPPGNDAPANAEILGPVVPVLVFGTSVNAVDDITSVGVGGLDTVVDGPDVFYRFTPLATQTYRFQLAPWQGAPLRSSDRRFALYILDDTNTPIAGARAPGSARPVNLDVALSGGVAYTLGVDHDNVAHDNFEFTLLVDALVPGNPDDCALAGVLPGALPITVLQNIDNAAADFTFTQSTDQCAVSGASPTTASGIDHVYKFTAPADGRYAIELVSSGFDGVIYVDDSCGPFFPDGCLGASNHSTSGSSGGKHELVVVDLVFGRDYWVFVDNGSTTNLTGPYALVIDTAFNYEINEVEPNDIPTLGTPLGKPLNGGQLVGPEDEDWWTVSGATGDRVYAWANNGGSSNSTLDTDLGFFAADGATLIEFDDEDGDGANAPVEDLRYIYSTTSPVIAGARFTSGGSHYLRVTDQSATGTVHRYRLHTGTQPANRAPLVECEPNDAFATADRTGKNYFAGTITAADDIDFYAVEADLGDRVFVALDGDPERDADGSVSASSDPLAFAGKLVIYDPDGDILISDVSDSNTIQSAPDYPAQGGFFVARHTGTHYVEVRPASTSTEIGNTATYELAIFLDENRGGAATEDIDPDLLLTPDFGNNRINVAATDNAAGDTGICAVELVNALNVQVSGLSFTPGDGSVSFSIELIDTGANGSAKLVVTDCAGNVSCSFAIIDVSLPNCSGFNFSGRSRMSMHGPIHVPNNDLAGTTDGFITIDEPGLVTSLTVTVNALDTLDTGDIDIYLRSPSGTEVELVTDRMSSSGTDMRDTTFTDDADEIVPFLGSAAPYTGAWLPEDAAGLAQLAGEPAQGDWILRVVDDSSSADFGATLVKWTLDLEATFAGPETFAGRAADTNGFGGIDSIVLSGATNVQLNLPPGFTPGDPIVEYTVTLIDPTANGSGTVTVTDTSLNTCQSIVTLAGLTDGTDPMNSGSFTTDLTFGAEVQQVVPENFIAGVTSTINLPDSFLVGEVEVALTVDSDNQGRIASDLSHGGQFATLVNRISMDERASSGNTKNSFDVLLDDDAPEADDIHNEPSLGSESTLGLHQPDGRGDFFGDGITSDPRDNMLFRLAGLDSAGDWTIRVADTRAISSSENIFRRWAMTLKNPCGPERYVGTAKDLPPGSGIASISLGAGGAPVNLQLITSFTPGDPVVEYRVEQVDPTLAGGGVLLIVDGAGNQTLVPISLDPVIGDDSLPVVGGTVDLVAAEFVGTATDNAPGDTGIVEVALAPFSDNLQIVSVTPDPPAGAGSVDFVVGLVDPLLNGRGYVRVTDDCGLRGYALVEIDAQPPICTLEQGTSKRFFSGPVNTPLPDNNPAGVSSSIIVTDPDIVGDVDLTFNITHAFDDDIELALTSPVFIGLISDRGGTGNDFIDTTLDDEAAVVLPDSSSAAPFTGSFQPADGVLSTLDGGSATGTYTLRAVDDKTNDFGTFNNWSLRIKSPTYPESFDGRAEDNRTHDAGICTIFLENASANLVLTVDPAFVPGDRIARFTVDQVDPRRGGVATLVVRDCAGNRCEQTVSLCVDLCDSASVCPHCDIDCDGTVTGSDLLEIINTANFGMFACEAADGTTDANYDGIITGTDFLECLNTACFGM